MAGRIVIDLFTTLDGVAQAPGSPDEDPSGGFEYGGWQAPLVDESMGEQVMEGIRSMDALLLGGTTYDIFAAYWPQHVDGPDGEIGRRFDSIPKYVASRGAPVLPWRDSHLLGPSLSDEIAALRERHQEVHVIGSVDFSRSLVASGLFDVLNLWVYPIVLGSGKRLFPDDGPALGLTLLEPPVAGESGALLLRYGPGPAVTTGDMG
ncbi:dihydrofolate reductase family protein [Herbiconiux sp. KACC 21604]|uniref:dihydrofolate reductase family protein n=1 Tax=unclassified Herbiconiux TaxID=2618217 RepID=UPI001491BE40|nr:dihydrofolate reductase family protein [Herbiconiux sp. SALV-R1]QJU53974.1 deaminase [Herbiconiux sp. SALV-R1]WPO85002.1 dihydrofolate reductase family protein [Herbiconiux sp. KACC 21604]